ncbi:hypothetical protein IJ541_10915 [bacterium]|nr:hypothetical protein [bacterium]
MSTVHMNGYDIVIRRRSDGMYDVSQHCTNGRIGASRMLLNNDEELEAYLATKGIRTDVFVKEENDDKSDIYVAQDNKNGIGVMSSYARLATLFPFLVSEPRPIISLFTGNQSNNNCTSAISLFGEKLAEKDIHSVQDYFSKFKDLDKEFEELLLPRAYRKHNS